MYQCHMTLSNLMIAPIYYKILKYQIICLKTGRNQAGRFTEKQIQFLVKIYDDGEKTKAKKDAVTVAEMMRTK